MQADGFAKKLGYASGLRGGLVKLQVTFIICAFILLFSWFDRPYLNKFHSKCLVLEENKKAK